MATSLVIKCSLLLGVIVIFIAILSFILKCFVHSLRKTRTLSTDMNKNEEHTSPLVHKQWQIDSRRIKLCEPIGEGAFGRVYRGLLDGKLTVAVKMLKDSATERELTALTKEVSLMSSLQKHGNVIELLGCCWTTEGFQIVMEYAIHGNLRTFLRSRRPDNKDIVAVQMYNNVTRWYPDVLLCPKKLTDFALQIACGMQYLASLKIIHRDLAARNILVADGNDDYALKIADFGLTREAIANKDYYRHTLPTRVPVKWMSPESMTDGIYTTKSDIWSYGIALWEIYTLGDNPYPSIPPQNLYALLESGYRMPKPPKASDNIYDVMTQCWQFKPTNRPDFTELVVRMTSILEKEFDARPLEANIPGNGFQNYEWRMMAPDDNGNVAYDQGMLSSDMPLLGTG